MIMEKPGSLIAYAESVNLSPSEAAEEFSRIQDEYRHSLADVLGITLEQLHSGDYDRYPASPAKQLETSSF